MANYNYVAPIQYKSYSDMNKERLAAKAAKEAAGLKQKSTIDTRKQKFYDNMTGYKTAGWADSHRTEYNMQVQRALSEVATSSNPDYGGISDAIIRMQEIGDNHANLRDGQTEYNSYMGENAPNYDADLDWGMSATHDKTGYDERLTTFNNLGLLNYSNGRGDFPNPNYDPSAAEGTAGSFKSMRDLLKSKGVDTQMSNGREVYADEDGQLKPISGSAFDVATEQFSGLWNPTLSAINNITAEDAFFGYSNIPGGKAKFENHAITLNKQVGDKEITYEAAKENLKADILNYVDPNGVSPDRALISSAITAYDEGTGQTWVDAGNNEALINTYGTPWEYFANQMVGIANLDDPDNPGRIKNPSRYDLLVGSFNSIPVGMGQTQTSADPQFERELGSEEYDWDTALSNSKSGIDADDNKVDDRTQEILDLTEVIDILDKDGNFISEKRVLKDLGNGVKIGIAQDGVKFDKVYLDNVEVFPDENIVIVYASGYTGGDVGLDIGEEGDAWRYNPLFGGKEGQAPFVVLNRFQKDNEGEYILATEGQTDRYGVPYEVGQKLPSADYVRLMTQFDSKLYRNALEEKIASAEGRRVAFEGSDTGESR